MEKKTARNKAERGQRERRKPISDPYFAMVQEQWPYILMFYKKFEDKKPIMLFDIQEQRIYAYLSFARTSSFFSFNSLSAGCNVTGSCYMTSIQSKIRVG
jgi:hypothetical protein